MVQFYNEMCTEPVNVIFYFFVQHFKNISFSFSTAY